MLRKENIPHSTILIAVLGWMIVVEDADQIRIRLYAELVQENATAGISQVALNYRDILLSEDRAHGGSLRARDRVPDMPTRLRLDGDWAEASRLALVAAVPDGTTLPSDLKALVPESRYAEIAASTKDAARFETTFGKAGPAVLVRPERYAGLTSPISSAAEHLRLPPQMVQRACYGCAPLRSFPCSITEPSRSSSPTFGPPSWPGANEPVGEPEQRRLRADPMRSPAGFPTPHSGMPEGGKGTRGVAGPREENRRRTA